MSSWPNDIPPQAVTNYLSSQKNRRAQLHETKADVIVI